ncbi:glycoside hydrolase family 18 [Sphingobacterium spiritivorum]|uniref:glycoside hydrolase family 18 n=1 Tax=Sphingobacterium spiritivorum TaxID=258 RepID=UPI003DA5B879
MKRKINLKRLVFSTCCLWALTLILVSCEKWTETETVKIEDPDIRTQNPELYAAYLANLKAYKNSKHKVIYGWFDNHVKTPINRGQHIENVPDSVDFVVLKSPDKLIDRELQQMDALRNEKGTKVIFGFDYDGTKLAYDLRMDELKKAGKLTGSEKDFETYLSDTLQYTLQLIDKYKYDGIIAGYRGKSTAHMTDSDKEVYSKREKIYMDLVSKWYNDNKGKVLVFEGYPQNLTDKTILASCLHIILPDLDVKGKDRLSYNILMTNVEGVPTDRFIVTASTVSLDKTDTKTGIFSDGSRALGVTAGWAAATHSGYTVSGLGIYNMNNDYFNTYKVYQYTREAIYTLNPSIIK